MKSRFRLSVILLSVTLVVTGCDFFRVLAGRPMSKEIEAKRAEILRSAQDDKDSLQVVKPEMTEPVPVRPAGTASREKSGSM